MGFNSAFKGLNKLSPLRQEHKEQLQPECEGP